MLKNVLGAAGVAVALAAGSALAGEKTVRASSFGWDAGDATKCLQTALDSGAEEVVVDRQAGDWLIHDTINGRSNQRVVFEKGVSLVAVPGDGFRESWGGNLVKYMGCSNVVLSGCGARLVMDRKTFTSRPYDHNGHRHTLNIFGCANVTVEGLEINGSGGDSVYVGAGMWDACRNIVLRDLVVANGYRQGLSVISAENLLIEGCTFRDTAGTAPAAGIDFEPNSPHQRLSKVVVRDCVFVNNAACGLEFALPALDATTEPLDILVERCRSYGNSLQFKFATINVQKGDVGGRIVVRDCDFDAGVRGTLFSLLRSDRGAEMRFENCRVREQKGGGFHVLAEKDWQAMVACPVFVNGQVQILEVPTDFSAARPIDEKPGEMVEFPEVPSRYGASYVFHAARAGEVRFRMRTGIIVAHGTLADSPMQVLTLDGKPVGEAPMPGRQKETVAVTVPSAGWYRLKVGVGAYAFVGLSGTDVPVALDDPNNLIRPTTTLYFEIQDPGAPAALNMAGGGTKGEALMCRLVAPSGKPVWKEDAMGVNHRYRFLPGRETGLWSLGFSKSPVPGTLFEDASVRVVGLPRSLFPCREKRWTWCTKGR